MARLKPLDMLVYYGATVGSTALTSHFIYTALDSHSMTGVWVGAAAGSAVCSAISINQFLKTFGASNRRKWNVFARTTKTGLDPDIVTRTIKYKEPQTIPDEFYFVGNGVDIIPETKLYKFVVSGWKRQQQVRDKTLVRGPAGSFIRLTSRDVWSTKYFERSQRLDRTEVKQCFHILVVCQLLGGRKQGTGGRLIEEPGRAVEIAKGFWASTYPSPPREGRRGFLAGRFFQLGKVQTSPMKLVKVGRG